MWANRKEVERMADYLKMSVSEFRQRYMRRIGLRWTLIEEPLNRDCIFLHDSGGRRGCVIYEVRPRQCRTWPFWVDNLTNAGAWNQAAQRCLGINRGKLYSFDEIQSIKKGEKWWERSPTE
jgi:Fe-S-cluster containining protein